MRYTLAFMVVALALTGTPLWAQQPPAAVPSPAPSAPPALPLRQIIPGKSMAGVEVGAKISLIQARFGRPSEVRETGLDTVYLYSRFGITVYAQRGVVTAVSTSNSLLKIGDAIGPGSRVEEVTATFGTNFRQGTTEAFPGMIYDATGVAFGVDGKAVALVMVFRPNTASQVSGLMMGRSSAGTQAPVSAPTAGYPDVGRLKGFSPESQFMSLPGYLRWLVNQTSGTWITFAEANRIVQEQRGGTR